MRKSEQKFSFWPSDWIGGTSSLSPAERGVYIDLLAEQWQRGPLDEAQALAAGRADAEIVRQVLAKKFHQNPDGRWQNNRLEQERQRAGRDKPKKAPRIDSGERLLISGLEGLETGLTLYRPAEPPLLVFPCRGEPSSWGLTAEQVDKWQRLYEGLDVLGEARKALAWAEANGQKTAKGMPRFLVSWLGRAADRSGGAGRQAPQTFRERDASSKRVMLRRLKFEEMGLSREQAERLANLDEQSAARELLNLKRVKQIEEEIPW